MSRCLSTSTDSLTPEADMLITVLYVVGFVVYLLGVERNVVRAALWPLMLALALLILGSFIILGVVNSFRKFR
jgi:hypothetical protein